MNVKSFFVNIGNILKKAFKVANLEKIIGFLSFEAISFYFSLSMFLQIGTTVQAKIAMGIATVAAESFKVMLITALSNSGYSLAYYSHRLKMGKEYVSVYLKHLKTYLLAFVFYFITAGVSFIATVGFGLATTYQYSQLNQIVDNSNAIATIQSNIDRYQAEIDKYEALNREDQKSADSYRATAEQFNTVETRANRNYYLGLVTSLIGKMEARNAQIQIWNADIKKWSGEIIALQTVVTDDGKESQKSIFDLMEISLNQKISAENIMLLIVVILALVIEIGLVYTSPKIHELDEEKDFELYPNFKRKKKKDDSEPTEKIVEKVVEKIVEVPVEKIVEKVVEVPIDRVVEVEKIVEKIVEVPVDRVVEVEKIVEKIVETPIVEEKTETLVEEKEPTKAESSEKNGVEKNDEEKKVENFVNVINKMFTKVDQGKAFLVSEEDLARALYMNIEKVKKIYKYLEFLGLISFDKSSSLWRPKKEKNIVIDIVKSKLMKH